ncbi:MAG: 30S ribosomal protein S7 [Gammaproteobacteria bacterium CG_4_10_14_0_8_um_filter_38_16]|nr:MAG: 30S ribosomal protein S7 [Gammaproteobacteria bacterium CG_4_10_14_0_8_um_filter_38_16]PJA02745.1 MAG: 30S ribosomal protein S7 [Gammaproteobacteria bacterium CG_4_10_14_0_2_um_filter_38_22]PJB10499.1 MAG: 30S ribosomal protein S7 [Gammaproteobacteria bacterium CG_4_9_14_3_um_filter_38_9]
MARRKAAPKREILPDPLFKSKVLAKFINSVMRGGKKSVAESAVYGALDHVVKQLKSANKLSVVAEHQSEEEGDSSGKNAVASKPTGDIRLDEASRIAALNAFKSAIDNITPQVEVKSRRVGGSTYQVPVEIRAVRRSTLAMRWLVEYANKRNEKTMVIRLANEIMDAIENRGGAVKKREDVHRMAKANQAFAHYRW